MKQYVVTQEADMLAPKWLTTRINYYSIKFVYAIHDGSEILKGVKIGDETAKIGDTICFDGKRISIEKR